MQLYCALRRDVFWSSHRQRLLVKLRGHDLFLLCPHTQRHCDRWCARPCCCVMRRCLAPLRQWGHAGRGSAQRPQEASWAALCGVIVKELEHIAARTRHGGVVIAALCVTKGLIDDPKRVNVHPSLRKRARDSTRHVFSYSVCGLKTLASLLHTHLPATPRSGVVFDRRP